MSKALMVSGENQQPLFPLKQESQKRTGGFRQDPNTMRTFTAGILRSLPAAHLPHPKQKRLLKLSSRAIRGLLTSEVRD